MIHGRLRVSIELTLPTRGKRDIDNHAKAPLDAVEASGLIRNDEQIDELYIRRMRVESPGCCDITLEEIRQ